jgi:hypothetical protein
MSHAIGVLEIYSDAIRSCDDIDQGFVTLFSITFLILLAGFWVAVGYLTDM